VKGLMPIRKDVGAQPAESKEVVSAAPGGDWEYGGFRTPSKGLYPSRIRE
jgi:5-oxopent-3-ene-1,2,5-tricarboxylate decarboxylase/2-hydroxyhepta-2,4-diene-1,7-dioate isomerase